MLKTLMLKTLLLKTLPITLVVLATVASGQTAADAQEDGETLIFAAASLKNALDDALQDYQERTGKTVTVSYAASSVLAKQIEAGAPADMFFSADLQWMDYLAERDLIAEDTRLTLLGNSLVLVAPAGSAVSLDIEPGFKLAEALGDGRLSMAAAASVPAGRYGKAALESLGVWEGVSAKVAEAENVRGALAFVARDEAPLGIVYATDAEAEPAVQVVDTFPEDSHPPILYPIALTKAADGDARAVLRHLQSAGAKADFEAQGFRVVTPGS